MEFMEMIINHHINLFLTPVRFGNNAPAIVKNKDHRARRNLKVLMNKLTDMKQVMIKDICNKCKTS